MADKKRKSEGDAPSPEWDTPATQETYCDWPTGDMADDAPKGAPTVPESKDENQDVPKDAVQTVDESKDPRVSYVRNVLKLLQGTKVPGWPSIHGLDHKMFGMTRVSVRDQWVRDVVEKLSTDSGRDLKAVNYLESTPDSMSPVHVTVFVTDIDEETVDTLVYPAGTLYACHYMAMVCSHLMAPNDWFPAVAHAVRSESTSHTYPWRSGGGGRLVVTGEAVSSVNVVFRCTLEGTV